MVTTLIRNIDWAILWNGERHEYARNIDLVFADDEIVYAGADYDGAVDVERDGTDLMVIPGFVNVHGHPSHEPAYRGIREEHGVPNMYMTGLYERSGAFDTSDPELRTSALEMALCELLKSGVTSVCDISPIFDGWLELFERSGVRGFLAPGFASARWKLANDHELGFDWDDAGGRSKMDRALAFIDQIADHPSGRLSGVVSPMQIENCTDDLLRDSFDAANDRKVPFTLHISQGVLEFHEMIRRHGRTPIQHAADIGIMGPSSVFGHAIFPDTHSWTGWWTKEDVSLLADSGSSVAHCPTPFARYGHIMENFGDYVRAGVNMAIGTDTTPHNMIEEIRKAGTFARIAARDLNTVSTEMLFHAATVGGAKALLRDDLGRLATGCKADFVAVDLSHPDMMPARDPLRSLIFHAADRAVKEVWVAGRQLVADGAVLGLDHVAAGKRLSKAQIAMMESSQRLDYKGRSTDELAPLSLAIAKS
ncbi:amidohydrolase family protein [Pikeienuella piscinae]|uniref:Amidohydrolase family protein n=1 Tax=Pikeienuella piscinae TaxID=2748098 RepID=A0A7L5BXU7_9RHOB|nr:amidohydrolase family protein [Pikeienuella piscinae]QIE56745.1 amidohydrolase family protein [Pikeienuella piscinae]